MTLAIILAIKSITFCRINNYEYRAEETLYAVRYIATGGSYIFEQQPDYMDASVDGFISQVS